MESALGETSTVSAPASSSAFRTSASSTCSTPSVARIATRFPSSERAISALRDVAFVLALAQLAHGRVVLFGITGLVLGIRRRDASSALLFHVGVGRSLIVARVRFVPSIRHLLPRNRVLRRGQIPCRT